MNKVFTPTEEEEEEEQNSIWFPATESNINREIEWLLGFIKQIWQLQQPLQQLLPLEAS